MTAKKKKNGAAAGDAISVRMYNVGFGDCFLFRIPTTEGERRILVDCGFHSLGKGDFSDKQIVERIKSDLNGEALHVVVATHRHQDHISGFGESALWDGVGVEEVWLPFTANPASENDEPALRAWRGLMGVAATLVDGNGTLAPQVADALAARDPADRDAIAFMLWNARSNQPAIDNLLNGFKRTSGGPSTRRFLPDKKEYPTSFSTPVLPGVTVHVLGPPIDPAMRKHKKVPSTWAFDAAMAGGPSGSFDSPFSSEWQVPRDKLPSRRPFMEKSIDLIKQFNDDLMFAAKSLDGFLNGESLVLLLEIGNARLLLPGDAEVGTWEAILANPKAAELASSATFVKVGHHGSHNATPLSWIRNKLSARAIAAISTQEGKGNYRNGIPLDDLLNELATKHIHFARSDKPGDAAPGSFTAGPQCIDCRIPC